jgi:hypothetical protein
MKQIKKDESLEQIFLESGDQKWKQYHY